MKTSFRISTTALMTLASVPAIAQSMEAQIRDQLVAQGFADIWLERSGSRLDVDADRGSRELELIFDSQTGELLSQRWTNDDESDDDESSGNGRDDDEDEDDDDDEDDDNDDYDEDDDED